MPNQNKRFRRIDALLIFLILLPLAAGIVLKVLFTPEAQDIQIAGALIYFTLPLPLGGFPVTESQVNSVLVVVSVFFLCLYLTHGLSAKGKSKRQILCEWVVEKTQSLVDENMGPYFHGFAPFIGAVMALSAFSSLLSLLGLYPPTSDLNVVAGWAILVFVLITHYKLQGGLGPYVKGFFEPVPVFAPFNIIGEFATPVSMSFRHYGNVLSGVVISTLVAYALLALKKFSFDATVAGVEAAESVPAKAEDNGENPLRPQADVLPTLAAAHDLTPRETEVFELLAAGRNGVCIQQALGVSYNTVKTHVAHIYAKLGVHTHQELLDFVGRQ